VTGSAPPPIAHEELGADMRFDLAVDKLRRQIGCVLDVMHQTPGGTGTAGQEIELHRLQEKKLRLRPSHTEAVARILAGDFS
jgi:hypothetical protein